MKLVANRRICGLSQPRRQRRDPFAWSVRRADRCPLLTACSPRAHSMGHVTAWARAWQSHILDAIVVWRRVERPRTRLVGPHGPKTTNLIMATNGYRIVDAADATRRQEIATLSRRQRKTKEADLRPNIILGRWIRPQAMSSIRAIDAALERGCTPGNGGTSHCALAWRQSFYSHTFVAE
jgi:hypothetical protein